MVAGRQCRRAAISRPYPWVPTFVGMTDRVGDTEHKKAAEQCRKHPDDQDACRYSSFRAGY